MGCRSLNDKAESKRDISDGFMNGFSVQSPYLLSATVLSLRRLPHTNWGFPLPCVGLLIVRPVPEPNRPDYRADLRRALQLWAGCTNLPQPRGTSPRRIFGLSSILSPYLCLYRKWLLPRLLPAFSPSTPSAQDHLLALPLVPPSVPL